VDVTIDEICKLVAIQLGRRRVAADERLVEDLGAESLDLVNLAARLEERYGVTVDETELPDLRTPADFCECVRERLL
jgi:acyl carrier protein